MFGIFRMFRVAARTASHMKEMKKLAAETAALPMPEFVARWSAMYKEYGGHIGIALRSPAKRMDIVKAQARLGIELPEELKMFYAQANGFEWTGESESPPFASAETLDFGAAAKPPLSQVLRTACAEDDEEEGEPMGVKVFTPDLASLMADDHDKLLPFTDFDEMLVLEPWREGQATVMIAKAHKHYPAGTVLDIEGGTATRHATLRQSLAEFASAMTSLGRMMKDK